MLSLQNFITLSLKFNPHFNPEKLEELYVELEDKSRFIRNKKIVKIIRKHVSLKQQESYEYLSQLAGYASWNIASSKSVDFTTLFTDKIRSIPLAMPILDSCLLGGLPRQSITLLMGYPYSGKTMCSVSIGANALRQGFRVLHLSFNEVMDAKVLYSSNLNAMGLDSIVKEGLTEEEVMKVYLKKYKDSLKVVNLSNESLEELVLIINRAREEFGFDLIILDNAFSNIQLEVNEVTNYLKFLSQKEDCVVLCASDFHRQEKDLVFDRPRTKSSLVLNSSVILSIAKSGDFNLSILKSHTNKSLRPIPLDSAKVREANLIAFEELK